MEGILGHMATNPIPSIEKVKIHHGAERPIKIEVHMKSEVGFFQVEEVLIPKIQSSPATAKERSTSIFMDCGV